VPLVTGAALAVFAGAVLAAAFLAALFAPTALAGAFLVALTPAAGFAPADFFAATVLTPISTSRSVLASGGDALKFLDIT